MVVNLSIALNRSGVAVDDFLENHNRLSLQIRPFVGCFHIILHFSARK